MVLHVRRWVVSSGVGHPVSMRGILAFARAEFMIFRGGGLSWVPAAVFPAGLTLWRGTRLPWRGWCQDGSGCVNSCSGVASRWMPCTQGWKREA